MINKIGKTCGSRTALLMLKFVANMCLNKKKIKFPILISESKTKYQAEKSAEEIREETATNGAPPPESFRRIFIITNLDSSY